jgi:hypothetical protein
MAGSQLASSGRDMRTPTQAMAITPTNAIAVASPNVSKDPVNTPISNIIDAIQTLASTQMSG